MGDGVSHMNNWTVWYTQNVLLAASLSGLPNEQMREIVWKACQSIDFTSVMPVWEKETGMLVLGGDTLEAVSVQVTGAASVQIERLPITDARLQTAWKQELWRTRVVFAGNLLKLLLQNSLVV